MNKRCIRFLLSYFINLSFNNETLVLLQELQKSGDLELEDFTASDVERALWSTAAATMPKKSSKNTAKTAGVPAAGGTKRKRR